MTDEQPAAPATPPQVDLAAFSDALLTGAWNERKQHPEFAGMCPAWLFFRDGLLLRHLDVPGTSSGPSIDVMAALLETQADTVVMLSEEQVKSEVGTHSAVVVGVVGHGGNKCSRVQTFGWREGQCVAANAPELYWDLFGSTAAMASIARTFKVSAVTRQLHARLGGDPSLN